jgi:phage shock protein PspC (stress-responsive transcriptional regulator)
METTHNTQATQVINHRLERPTHGRVLGGVSAAIANRTGASVGLVRLAFLAAGLFGGFGVVLYLAAWALVPGEGEAGSAAEGWLENLKTPGKRIGAALIGLAGLIILTGAAPITVLVAATLLAGAVLLSTDQRAAGSESSTTGKPGTADRA